MGNTVGIAWGFGSDIEQLASDVASDNFSLLTVGKDLAAIPYDIALPHYGWYGGAGWGTTQFGNAGVNPAPFNQQDWANFAHDVSCAVSCNNAGWVANSYNGNGSLLPTGPIGNAYRAIGTLPFSASSIFQ